MAGYQLTKRLGALESAGRDAVWLIRDPDETEAEAFARCPAQTEGKTAYFIRTGVPRGEGMLCG